ncbi:TPA: bifunctional hydroxymethylpyrimidine kinase/phosphomethylpyrimidine kinase [Neisseria weaveri]
MKHNKPFPRVLTIAGSDSGGGAGIQADLKTFGALGAYGASVITAVTAQNTTGVQGVYVIPPEVIEQQCESVLSDIRIDAVKIGMLPDAASIQAVARVLRRFPVPFVVLDPVLVATSGDKLALEDTVGVLCRELLPLASIITPNLNELAQLTGNCLAENEAQMLEQGKQLLALGAKTALLKGGHWENSHEARDWLLQKDAEPQCFVNSRIPTENTHGTGCTLAAAIAALHPHRSGLHLTVAAAKSYLHGAIDAGQYWKLGNGHGPLAHFWRTVR